MDDIDFSVVDNMEVIKGPAATMYGGGVGGVLRCYMKPETTKGITLSQRLNVGSWNMLQTNTRLDVVTDKSASVFNYTHVSSDGYRPRGQSVKNCYSWLGNYQINAKQKLSLYLAHSYSLEGVTGQISYADYYAGIDPGNDAYAKKNARNDFRSTRASATYQTNFNKYFNNSTSVFFSYTDKRRVAAGVDENSLDPNMGLRSIFSYNRNIGEQFLGGLELGTELQQSGSMTNSFRFTGTNDSIPLQVQGINSGASLLKLTTNQQSVFAIARITYRPWDLMLLAGVSYNKLDYHRRDLLAAPGLSTGYNKDLSFDQWFKPSMNPHVALQKSWKGQIFNLCYAQGYNAPTSATAFISGINKTNDGLLPERGRMLDFSVQGLLAHTLLDYQFSIFSINIDNKLTQLNDKDPVSGTAYSYWANTGKQRNRGLEASIGYTWMLPENNVLDHISPFANCSWYDFSYTDFQTKSGSTIKDYSGKKVVGVPRLKYVLGLDIVSPSGIYLNNTFTSTGAVYTDFGNTNKVKGFTQYNAKLGYRHHFEHCNLQLDVYVAGNNLASQKNYTFLFLGNNINDGDAGSNYPPGVATDVNPGPSKAWFYGGFIVKYTLPKVF
ncbi:Vitamin B12 transporter BtuB [compost metagenome]